MTTSLQLALTSVVSQEQLDGLRNVLSNAVRSVSRLTNGHETLLVVVFVMLILIYLYIRKA
jgi:hypothetical protein